MYNQGLVKPHKSYFFWNDRPYRLLKESRRRNYIIAFDLIDKKRVVFRWTDWKRNHKSALSTQQAARALNRHWTKLYDWIRTEKIPRPFHIDGPEGRASQVLSDGGRYLWSEKDLKNAVDYMESTGRLNSSPTWGEVKASLNDGELIKFVQSEDGEFIPIWKAD